eukprot:10791144-Ditylum_brightwellii.AAC.3
MANALTNGAIKKINTHIEAQQAQHTAMTANLHQMIEQGYPTPLPPTGTYYLPFAQHLIGTQEFSQQSTKTG